MKRIERIANLYHERMIEMYKQADPPADYKKLLARCQEIGDKFAPECNFYNDHVLDEKTQREIIEAKIKESKIRLKKWEYTSLMNNIWLGASPRFTKKQNND